MTDSNSAQAHPAKGVLIVCHSDNTLNALAAILAQSGETGLTAQNAKDGWECIKAGVIGCVVLDITSAATEALALFRAARSSVKACSIPFLFLVSNDSRLSWLDTMGPEVAPDSWLALPCSADQFLQKIRGLFDPRPVLNNSNPVIIPAKADASAAAAPLVQMEELLSAKGSVFAGQLGVLDVTKILSMVEPLRLTGVLKVADGKRYGQVHFVNGAVRHAELKSVEGADALFLLFHLKTGAFRFDIEEPTTKKTIVGNTMSLLLEGLRQMDEAKAQVKSLQQARAAATGAAATPAS